MKTLLKLFLPALVGFMCSSILRSTAYNVDSSAYFKFLDARDAYNKESTRWQTCGLVWKLRTKHKMDLPLSLNCFSNDSEGRIDFNSKFGTSIGQANTIYNELINAVFEYEYTAKNKYKIAFRTLVGLENKTPELLSGKIGNVYLSCSYQGTTIEVFGIYKYGIHTPNRHIYIPEAIEIMKNCKEN